MSCSKSSRRRHLSNMKKKSAKSRKRIFRYQPKKFVECDESLQDCSLMGSNNV